MYNNTSGSIPNVLYSDPIFSSHPSIVELNKNPTYVALSMKFTMLHTLSAIANILSFCAQGVYLLYIASNMEL